MASTSINRTSGTPTSQKKATVSFWTKMCEITSNAHIFDTYTNDSNRSHIQFDDVDKIDIRFKVSGSLSGRLVTTRKFRDPSAWMNIIVALDTTQSTEADRIKLYINGTQETSFTTATYPSVNADVNLSGTHTIGAYGGGGNNFNGLLSHVHFTDGYAYDASTFGSTDNTTGQWKINTSPSVTYGTNGFFILKDGNSVTDQSGNGNNFTVAAGTLTKTEDCPDNIFAVMNPLLPGTAALTAMANGNTHNGDQSPNNWQSIGGTIGANTGKFYWEFKIESVWGSTSNTSQRHGIANLFSTLNYQDGAAGSVAWTDDPYAIGWQNSSGIRYQGDSGITMTSEFGTYVANDILMFAMDVTNSKLYFGKNGTWLNSGDPTSGSTGTGAYSMPDLGFGGMWAPYSETKYGSDKVSWNIGNGFFKTTAVTSAGTNASGNGIFEYDVPTGYTALSTKGLNL